MHSSPPDRDSPLDVLVGGERVAQSRLRRSWASPELQQVLLAAREKFGNALCMCRKAPLKLQIRLREGKLHLAVWPTEGAAHDSECLFFRDELAEGAHQGAQDAAPGEHASPGSAAAPARVALVLSGTRPAGAEPVISIRTLALRLWEAADLCRWHPRWTRDWGRSRYELVKAASGFEINGKPAESVLFVPRAYRVSKQQERNASWDQFVRELAMDRGGSPRLLIAPVRSLNLFQTAEKQHLTARLRHLHVPIGLAPACADFLARECRSVISNSRLRDGRVATSPEQTGPDLSAPEVMGFFSVESHSRGGVYARAAWLMAVHPRCYVPAASRDVVALIDRLLAGRYEFEHLPSEASASRRTRPDWIVRHVWGPTGIPVSRASLQILNRGGSADFLLARAEMARRLAAAGVPTWTWSPTGPRGTRVVPPLPPPDLWPREAAAKTLQEIADSPDADYGFEPNFRFTTDERKTA